MDITIRGTEFTPQQANAIMQSIWVTNDPAQLAACVDRFNLDRAALQAFVGGPFVLKISIDHLQPNERLTG